jgi:2-aminobenzoate-CoA ligase
MPAAAPGAVPSAHLDTFARDRLPAASVMAPVLLDLPQLQFPDRLNCAAALLDAAVARGDADRPCVIGPGVRWTYADVQAQSNRIAHVLVDDLGLVPGNRVLLRGANSPMLAVCWLAVVKAGGIAVGSMPLLRARELKAIIDKAQISHALCDVKLQEELALVGSAALKHVLNYGGDLEARAANKPSHFTAIDTAADDVALMAFTSGTTGTPKGTMHFHRDVMAACICWPAHVLRAQPDDVFIGSPPLAFTFGLGGLLLFPLSIGASTVLIDKVGPADLLPAIAR